MNVTMASGTVASIAVPTSAPSRSPHAPQNPHIVDACWNTMTSPEKNVEKSISLE